MHEQDRIPVPGSLVQIMDPQGIAVAAGDLEVVGLEGIVLEVGKTLIEGSQDLHRRPLIRLDLPGSGHGGARHLDVREQCARIRQWLP